MQTARYKSYRETTYICQKRMKKLSTKAPITFNQENCILLPVCDRVKAAIIPAWPDYPHDCMTCNYSLILLSTWLLSKMLFLG